MKGIPKGFKRLMIILGLQLGHAELGETHRHIGMVWHKRVFPNSHGTLANFNRLLIVFLFQINNAQIVKCCSDPVMILPVSFLLPTQDLFKDIRGFFVFTVCQMFCCHFMYGTKIVFRLQKGSLVQVTGNRRVFVASSGLRFRPCAAVIYGIGAVEWSIVLFVRDCFLRRSSRALQPTSGRRWTVRVAVSTRERRRRTVLRHGRKPLEPGRSTRARDGARCRMNGMGTPRLASRHARLDGRGHGGFFRIHLGLAIFGQTRGQRLLGARKRMR
mmetsp:Transcript_5665/g.16241  ORF Transcript_5665/g.16241 Transcript_5665/m.16241 type:complete len:272 (-) Transcript_5665:312-1127(-)